MTLEIRFDLKIRYNNGAPSFHQIVFFSPPQSHFILQIRFPQTFKDYRKASSDNIGTDFGQITQHPKSLLNDTSLPSSSTSFQLIVVKINFTTYVTYSNYVMGVGVVITMLCFTRSFPSSTDLSHFII